MNAGDTHDLRAYVDHVMHATVRVAGVEHVGLGPDFCDYLRDELKAQGDQLKDMVGLEDTTKLGAVVPELSKAGPLRGGDPADYEGELPASLQRRRGSGSLSQYRESGRPSSVREPQKG